MVVVLKVVLMVVVVTVGSPCARGATRRRACSDRSFSFQKKKKHIQNRSVLYLLYDARGAWQSGAARAAACPPPTASRKKTVEKRIEGRQLS